MDLEGWWPLLRQESRDWLVAHNGEALSAGVLDDIARVNGWEPSSPWSGLEERKDGVHLPDTGVDWVEAVANGESPEPPLDR